MELLSTIFNEIPIQENKRIRVETTTDAYQILTNTWSLSNYIEEYGDVKVVWDNEEKVYRVPAFKTKIEKYTAIKAANCKIWGSE